jgi:hypothetical protein
MDSSILQYVNLLAFPDRTVFAFNVAIRQHMTNAVYESEEPQNMSHYPSVDRSVDNHPSEGMCIWYVYMGEIS